MTVKLVELLPAPVDHEAVEMLEDAIAELKAGRAVGAAILLVTYDSGISTAWSDGCTEKAFVTLGGLDYLKRRFTREVIE